MRAVLKDSIRFALSADGGASAQLVIRVRQDRFGGWEAVALLHQSDAAPAPLGRVFRARERSLATAKMVAWVRRRYVQARPLAERASAALAVPRAAPGAWADLRAHQNRREERWSQREITSRTQRAVSRPATSPSGSASNR